MAEEKVSPIRSAEPAKANPLASPASAHASTLKLNPVVRPQGVAAQAKPETVDAVENPLEALKHVTSNLKGVTSAIPPQAILHKTGIIAAPGLSDAQKQAMKSKTSRISLSDAMGVAPVKEEAAPMKTIRIKRPTPAAAEAAPTSTTQRKTLKITRPGVNRAPAKPEVAEAETVADIPEMPVAPMMAAAPAVESDVGKGAAIMSLIVEIAACVTMGILAWYLYEAWERVWY